MSFFATTVFLDANHYIVAIESAGRQGGWQHGLGVSTAGMASFEAGRLARGNRRGVAGSLGVISAGLGPVVSLRKKRKEWDREEEDEEARSNGWTRLHRARRRLVVA